MSDFPQRVLQRKLIQWCLAYLAGAWALLQGIDFVADEFGWPNLVSRIALVLFGIGFLVVAVLAWYHGDQGRQQATVPEMIMIGSLLTIGVVAVVLLSRRSHQAASATTPLTAAPAAVERGSIAVLPFVNMSDDKSNEYFSDGITEETLNAIAKLPGLRVASRTSSFSFKGLNLPIDQIAQRLRVAHILEGSVRKSGQRVRITAQLIDARTDKHLWSEEYDRELQDLFAVQAEIARAIARALELELGGGLLAKQPTLNTRAHDHYLLGLNHWHRRTRGGLKLATSSFEAAIREDSLYADAWAGLALVHSTHSLFDHRVKPLESARLARNAAKRALELDSTLAQPHAAIGWALCRLEWKCKEGEAELRKAVKFAPNDAISRSWLGTVLSMLGRPDEALEHVSAAARLDPLSVYMHQARGMVLFQAGRKDEAAAELKLARSLEPDNQIVLYYLTRAYLSNGQYDSAGFALRRNAELSGYRHADEMSAFADALGSGDLQRARELLSRWDGVFSDYHLAVYHLVADDREGAIRLLGRSVDKHEAQLTSLARDSDLKVLHDDPRVVAILKRLGLR